MENLPLKKDALKELELPFEVKAGAWHSAGEGGSRTRLLPVLGTGKPKALEFGSV